tara:strand:+ start:847 stop:1362 length:516 start_codon:yes stop_codon:yes gene_type:complete
MSKNELEKIFDNLPALSYKEKLKLVENYLVNLSIDDDNIFYDGKKTVMPEIFKYKHSFAEGVYIREMNMPKGSSGLSVVQKYSYPFFVLTGRLATTTEEGIEELVAPMYFTSAAGGAQRLVHAIEDCTIVTVHHNPTNTKDLEKLEKYLYAFSWEEYEDFVNKKTKDEKNK